jgi:hypothetical protein
MLICMQPSFGGWARSADEARARVDAGFRNFLAGLEPMLLHFCVRRFLWVSDQGYYITDLSKGAMLVKRAGVARAERYSPLAVKSRAVRLVGWRGSPGHLSVLCRMPTCARRFATF